MDLNNKMGRIITEERKNQLAAYQEKISAQNAIHEAQERRQSEIKRLNRPFELTTKLLTIRGCELFSKHVNRDENEVSQIFRLRPATIQAEGQEKIASLDLKIRAALRQPNPGYGDIPGPFRLFIVMSMPGEPVTEHYLAHISKPIVKSDGLPENYGMRTYAHLEEEYEVTSSVPCGEEAEMIASAILEAAELEGIYNPNSGVSSNHLA